MVNNLLNYQKNQKRWKHVHFYQKLTHSIVDQMSVMNQHETKLFVLCYVIDVVFESVFHDTIMEFHHFGCHAGIEHGLSFQSRKEILQKV